ncbi:hypothetical protein [Endozoicomonas sp.]|uniref:hypothetical protein n=1 Tax=Endozoicomonas sp. TaxID=1892382 RepID=UPI0028846CA6|nr:hypothetical protein [Endozoicomonas sp.]
MSSTSENQSSEPAMEGYGSVEKGLSGNYSLSISGLLSESWDKTRGTKWIIHLAMGIYMGIYLLLIMAVAVAALVVPQSGGLEIIIELIMLAITTPLWAGIYMIGLRRAVNAPIRAGQVLDYFSKTLPLFGLYLLMLVLMLIGFALLVIPGIYLFIAYMLAIPLMVDKKMGIWEALETSRKAITKRWFTVFGLTLVIMLINFVAMLPLGLGLIWTVPMSTIAFGILYRNIFGCSQQTISENL